MLEARDITFGYGKHVLYRGFNLSISPGERVALSAPSGFGKTTLCRVLAGYMRPWSGEVLVDGRPLATKADAASPVQLIIQNPETAVDPRLRMAKTLAEAGAVPQRIIEGLGIRETWLSRFPHELSRLGGRSSLSRRRRDLDDARRRYAGADMALLA